MRRRALPLLLAATTAVAASVLPLHRSDAPTKAQRRSYPGPRASVKPSVLMIAFDEFPVDSLLEPDGRIDAARYPNFAALAGMSTWFVNGQASHDSTPHALPAIMDGRRPAASARATVKGHPTSVFTLFGDRAYRVVSSEEASDICPARLCPGAAKRRRGARWNLRHGRWGRLEGWISKIRPRARPTFYFKHALLPHHPWVFLPSGRHIQESMLHLADPIGFADPDLTRENERRMLLQVGFVDRAVGQLLNRLRRRGMLRDSMIVVTADHGVASDLGVHDRRRVTRRNIDEIANVPMFIKAPGQTVGRIDPAIAHTTDVLPTMAALLHVKVPWRTAGRSAFGVAVRRRRQVVMPRRDFRGEVQIGLAEMERRRRANRARRARMFGTGRSSSATFGSPWASVYRAGSHPDLIGRRVSALSVSRPQGALVSISKPGLWRHYVPAWNAVPGQVAGRVLGSRGGVKRDVVVAVNGRVRATGRTFTLKGSRTERFSLSLPESSLRTGRNRVEVFAVRGRARRLVLLGRTF
jgi:hypothetical protein